MGGTNLYKYAVNMPTWEHAERSCKQSMPTHSSCRENGVNMSNPQKSQRANPV